MFTITEDFSLVPGTHKDKEVLFVYFPKDASLIANFRSAFPSAKVGNVQLAAVKSPLDRM